MCEDEQSKQKRGTDISARTHGHHQYKTQTEKKATTIMGNQDIGIQLHTCKNVLEPITSQIDCDMMIIDMITMKSH